MVSINKKGVPEAPIDGQTYGRKDAGWVVGGGGVPEAPVDGQQYGRQSASWTVIPTSSGLTLPTAMAVSSILV